jgi:MFS family permease
MACGLWVSPFFLAYYFLSQTETQNRLALSVFLPALEVSIISTSLITIGDVLNGYDQISWIVTAYLVTYTGSKRFTKLVSTLTD